MQGPPPATLTAGIHLGWGIIASSCAAGWVRGGIWTPWLWLRAHGIKEGQSRQVSASKPHRPAKKSGVWMTSGG